MAECDPLITGSSYPLGATVCNGGVNFSVYSKSAESVELLLFNSSGDAVPERTIRLEAKENRTYHYWHIFVRGLTAGQIYGYRAYGPYRPEEGLRFNPKKVLLDPYGKAVSIPDGYTRGAACGRDDNAAVAMKSVVVDPRTYDWEGDRPLKRPVTKTIIYEMHVRGFTRHPSSGVSEDKRGTYAGLIEKIPYLKDLGVTAVELLPVFQYDAQDAPFGKVNYWGYTPVSFFAPHMQYSSRRGPLEVVDEFRDMVKALHRAGIEVILDVVYNHTTEEDAQGPTISFRGFENETYYLLEEDKAVYANYTGCGNTLNASNSIVRRLIIDSLRYWVEEMHVDGFRFDLASILTRDESGKPQANPPVLWDIESHPSLAGIKFIAEAWDAAGLYQVGSFIGDSWREWNGKFRDDVRRFLKGDTGAVSAFVSRLMASPDLFGHERREAEQSINFVTCHDGFTLNDLVSYNTKHNWVNGEKNCDGMDENLSWNCGVEGPAEDPGIEQLRNRQIKNFLTVTLLASGVPMLLMGDEVRRTQGGNNNAYCQDNEISWFDWTLLDKHPDIFRFTKHLIWYRQSRDTAIHDLRLTLHELLAQLRVKWHGVKLNRPDWSDHSHSIAMTTMSVLGRMVIHLMVNAYWQPLTFDVPRLPRYAVGGWRQCLDTSRASPEDIHIMDAAPIYRENNYPVQPRSIAMLVALMAQKPDVSSGRRANVSEENDENFDET